MRSIHAVYTLDELARIWRGVKPSTIYGWIKLERKAGRGPTKFEAIVRRDVQTKRSWLWIREDYARKLQDRYYFRAFREQRVRLTPESKRKSLKEGV